METWRDVEKSILSSFWRAFDHTCSVIQGLPKRENSMIFSMALHDHHGVLVA
jgi:hypothetical protein